MIAFSYPNDEQFWKIKNRCISRFHIIIKSKRIIDSIRAMSRIRSRCTRRAEKGRKERKFSWRLNEKEKEKKKSVAWEKQELDDRNGPGESLHRNSALFSQRMSSEFAIPFPRLSRNNLRGGDLRNMRLILLLTSPARFDRARGCLILNEIRVQWR